jgi:hypothetical protein
MKHITISRIGYNHPSQANWSYRVWKVDLIDTAQKYCQSYTTEETFGGDYRFREALSVKNIPVIETGSVPQCPKITGVRDMPKLDSDKRHRDYPHQHDSVFAR